MAISPLLNFVSSSANLRARNPCGSEAPAEGGNGAGDEGFDGGPACGVESAGADVGRLGRVPGGNSDLGNPASGIPDLDNSAAGNSVVDTLVRADSAVGSRGSRKLLSWIRRARERLYMRIPSGISQEQTMIQKIRLFTVQAS